MARTADLPLAADVAALARADARSRRAVIAGVDRKLGAAFSVVLGSCVTLAVLGYQFGLSNHEVYLLDALRQADPSLFARDWFMQDTLQYHAAFSLLTAALLKLHAMESGFLVGYLLLVLLTHVAWYRLVRRVGGGVATYLVSVLLYYVAAGGKGLGVYDILQDSALLPSNIAAVAALWGIYLWCAGRWLRAGVCFAVASAFHLNYAVFLPGLVCGLFAWRWWSLRGAAPSQTLYRAGRGQGEGRTMRGSDAAADSVRSRTNTTDVRPRPNPLPGGGGADGAQGVGADAGEVRPSPHPLPARERALRGGPGDQDVRATRRAWNRLLAGVALTCLSAGVDIAIALSLFSRNTPVPLDEFVRLYAKLRHPHHYDPHAWPLAIWLAFLLPVGGCVTAWAAGWLPVVRRESTTPPRALEARAEAARVFVLTMLALAVAFVFAGGVWFANERLIQMSLWRFSVFAKLLACVGVAWVLCDSGRVKRVWLHLLISLVPIAAAAAVLWAMSRSGDAATAGAAGIVNAYRVPITLMALLTTVLAAYVLFRRLVPRSAWLVRGVVHGVGIVGLVVLTGTMGLLGHLGIGGVIQSDPEMLEVGEWARQHAERDALFLAPPQDASFRLRSHRSAVVNFKHVPQLSGEIGAWRDRMEAVLGTGSLATLPTTSLPATLRAIEQRYAAIPARRLVEIARSFDADYLVAMGPVDAPGVTEVHRSPAG
jgi:hypothetical protein